MDLPLKLTLPRDLHFVLEQRAKGGDHSLTAEMLDRLQKSVDEEGIATEREMLQARLEHAESRADGQTRMVKMVASAARALAEQMPACARSEPRVEAILLLLEAIDQGSPELLEAAVKIVSTLAAHPPRAH